METMSYSDYSLDSLRHAFGLKVRDQPLFEQIGTLETSPWLAESLTNGQDLAVTSEKARSEFIVAPVLMACRAILGRDLRIFSGAARRRSGSWAQGRVRFHRGSQ